MSINLSDISIQTTADFENRINGYPSEIRPMMQNLRKLVQQTAKETEQVTKLEETLKWNEPSFVTKIGSTLRMDWKEKTPHQYAMYFQCSSRLVETFRVVFDEIFEFEGNRAIVFQIDQKLPIPELKECIRATLIYHKVKHLPTLGIS